jgi:crotonobetainyl-CoA:carnitine CoA-transferase CaiB-like acyl-CoA transferase
VAVNLARPSDLEALPAVVQADVDARDPWPAIEAFCATGPAQSVADRFQLLEVPTAVLDDPRVDRSTAVVLHDVGRVDTGRSPTVVDLSAMWAGPLCAHVLALAGLPVLKVEDTRRPDGARAGDPRFFAQLNGEKQELSFDFATPGGRSALAEVVANADVVIESSRPRALAQLGVDAEQFLRDRPGRTWVSITGYGRSGPGAGRVAFGDDAAVAGGLVAHDVRGEPEFCGDAVADPLSGLAAAAAAWRSIEAGGGHLIEVAMAAVAKDLAHDR